MKFLEEQEEWLEKICWKVGDKSIAARGRFQGEERIII